MFFLALLLGLQIQAKVIHQYFQKIESNGNHIGYTIVKEEHKPKKNQVWVTTFVKTNEKGGNITEGLKSQSSDAKLEPISYEYTAIIGEDSKTIDGVVRKGTLFATVSDGKQKKTLQKKLPEAAFFSSTLLPRVLRKGLSEGKNYAFQAIAEEDGTIHEGRIQVLEKIKIDGKEAYKLINDYRDNRFYSYVSSDGKVLKTENPVTKLVTKTVSSKQEAVGDISYPEVIIKTLFGTLP